LPDHLGADLRRISAENMMQCAVRGDLDIQHLEPVQFAPVGHLSA
jgi:hypothetical protein